MTKGQFEKLAGHQVRLFPSVRIRSEREAELRATSSLLAMILAVSEFGKGVVHRAGGPGGRLSCFTEPSFHLQLGEGVKAEAIRPDGVIWSVWGKKRWVAPVEVKVGSNLLEQEQVDKYHRLARQEGFHALITVSNQPARADGTPPVKLNSHLLKTVPVVHYSWDRLLSEAQVLSRRKAVSDPDQKWMLDEWVRYVDDPESKIVVPPHFGPHWGDVLKAFQTGSPPATSPELQDVVRHWVGYLRKAALRLRAKLGVDVGVQVTKAEKTNPQKHIQRLAIDTCSLGTLCGVLKVPDAAGNISVDVFLPSRCVRYSLAVAAPSEGKRATRVKWLARQLRGLAEMPSELQATAQWSSKGVLSEDLARDFADDHMRLLVDKQKVPIPKSLMPKRFILHSTIPLARCRGRSSAPVLEKMTEDLEDFYRKVVEGIMAYVPHAPRMPEPEEPHVESKSEESAGTSEEESVSEKNKK